MARIESHTYRLLGGGELSKLGKIIVEEKFAIVDEEKRKKKFNELFIKVIKQTEKTKTA